MRKIFLKLATYCNEGSTAAHQSPSGQAGGDLFETTRLKSVKLEDLSVPPSVRPPKMKVGSPAQRFMRLKLGGIA